MIWPIKLKRPLSPYEQGKYFKQFMEASHGEIIEYPDDISELDLHFIWIKAKSRKDDIQNDLKKYGGTYPGAYKYDPT